MESRFWSIQFVTYSAVTMYGARYVVSMDNHFVLLFNYLPNYICSASMAVFSSALIS